MTKEEAKEFIVQSVKNDVDIAKLAEALNNQPLITGVLPAEPKVEASGINEIINKIRTEILAEMQYHSGTGEEVVQAYADGLHDSIRIIDKYRAENEVEDGNDN